MSENEKLLRAALRKIAEFDFDSGCGVDDIMAFADLAWRGELDPEEVISLLSDDARSLPVDAPVDALLVVGKTCELSVPVSPDVAERKEPTRYRLPRERSGWTHHFTILAVENGQPVSVDGYITVNTYEDGKPGEIFVKMERQGSQASGFIDAFAVSMSMLLQLGVPLVTLLNKFENMRFEPSGRIEGSSTLALSPVDYVCKYLRGKFCK